MNDSVPSPLTGAFETERVGRVPVERIVDFYEGHLGVDVDRFFPGLETVEIRRCRRTGLEFYWPPETAGDEAFYSALAELEWYYDESRWEHARTVGWIEDHAREGGPPESVLDLGCGSGRFLELAKEAFPDATVRGVELSEAAARDAVGRGLDVEVTTPEELATREPGRYDLVTAFQVVEHLPRPRPFLDAVTELVRPGGLVVIGVPNNVPGAFLPETVNTPSYCLNMPPHHMGLWRPGSLSGLEKILPWNLLDMELEPFDEAQVNRVAYSRVAGVLGRGAAAKAAWRMRIHRVYGRLLRRSLMRLSGHTILAFFERSATGSGL